jgi:N-acetylglucosaminyl-diphospho-decaprenol L-rhamnosyltransferase
MSEERWYVRIVAVDVVVVSYNSRDQLRQCVEPLAAVEGVRPIVVDNASPDGSLEVIEDLPVRRIQLSDNRGFAAGTNAGWRAGSSDYVLLLNPDATIDASSLARLAGVLESEPGVGLAAPRIHRHDGALEHSQRRFPTLRSTYARALFLHRLFPRASWAGELVLEAEAYARAGSPDWVSGACLLIRRSLLEQLDGLDEGFFMYCEDKDLCRRMRDLGYTVRFEPGALAVHAGGASAPRPSLLPVLAQSRLRYARKHSGPLAALLTRIGIALIAATHAVAGRGGMANRAGHAASLRAALALRPR